MSGEKVEKQLWVTLNFPQRLDILETLRDGNFLVDIPDDDILQIDVSVRYREPDNA